MQIPSSSGSNGLNKLFFDAINRVMAQTGHMMKGGTSWTIPFESDTRIKRKQLAELFLQKTYPLVNV